MTIEERLENMEREVGCVKRRNRWLLAAILVLLGGLVAAGVFKTMITPVQAQGSGTAKEIRARILVIEDENGKIRAGLHVFMDGPCLTMSDENGKRRAELRVTKDGPALSLYDENGNERTALSVLKSGLGLWLYDENDKTGAWLGMDEIGPRLVMGNDNAFHASLSASGDGSGLTLFNKTGLSATFWANKDRPLLTMHDENGKQRVGLMVTKNDGPGITMSDENGKKRIIAGVAKVGTVLVLFDENGKVIWSAIK